MSLANIVIRREIPNRKGWTRDATCRILAGWYQQSYPLHEGAAVQVDDQIGKITGWSFCEWDGATPLAVNLYVEVKCHE